MKAIKEILDAWFFQICAIVGITVTFIPLLLFIAFIVWMIPNE